MSGPWTVTLLAMGLSVSKAVATLPTGPLVTTSMDFEGRIYRHEFEVIAVDDEHHLATAQYRRSRVLRRRPYRRRA